VTVIRFLEQYINFPFLYEETRYEIDILTWKQLDDTIKRGNNIQLSTCQSHQQNNLRRVVRRPQTEYACVSEMLLF